MVKNVTKLPNTKEFQLGDITLQLRLDGRSVLQIEKRLDESLVGLFMKGEGDMKLPPSNKLLIVLHGANQTSGVTEKAIAEGFYKFLDEGNSPMDLFEVVYGLLEDSGFFGKKDEAGESSKEKETEEETIL